MWMKLEERKGQGRGHDFVPDDFAQIPVLRDCCHRLQTCFSGTNPNDGRNAHLSTPQYDTTGMRSVQSVSVKPSQTQSKYIWNTRNPEPDTVPTQSDSIRLLLSHPSERGSKKTGFAGFTGWLASPLTAHRPTLHAPRSTLHAQRSHPVVPNLPNEPKSKITTIVIAVSCEKRVKA